MKITEELKTFIKSNEQFEQLLNGNTKESWKELLLKAKNESNKLVNDFIAMIYDAEIKISGLDVYKYAKDKKEFQDCDGQPIELSKIKLFLLKHKVCLSVNIEDEKIIIVGIEERNPTQIWETPRLSRLFKEYSNITLEKAKSGNFKDLIHFVVYHTIKNIGVKSVDEMIEKRWLDVCNDKAYLSKLSGLDLMSMDLNENILAPIKKLFWEKCTYKDLELYQRLGYYCCNEVYLCDNLMKEIASLSSPSNLVKQVEIFEQLYKKVFTHEMGHLVFDWTGEADKSKKEKQANYFSSYINNGEIDDFIVAFTKKQPKEYRNPYLLGDTKAENLYKYID